MINSGFAVTQAGNSHDHKFMQLSCTILYVCDWQLAFTAESSEPATNMKTDKMQTSCRIALCQAGRSSEQGANLRTESFE